MSLELSLLCFAIFSLLFVYLIATYFRFDLKFKVALLFFTLIIFFILFLFGVDFYKAKSYLKAFNSNAQTDQCGTFDHIQIDHPIISNPFNHNENFIYLFKAETQEIIEFNGGQTTQQLYPLLFQLQKNDQICFKYATDMKDWNGRFYLTKLTKTTAPLD